MMKFATKIATLCVAILALLALNGCTKQNGDIGAHFGLWHLESYTVDGAQAQHYEGNVFFAFQGEITRFDLVKPNHEVEEQYGNWENQNGLLVCWFPSSITGRFDFIGVADHGVKNYFKVIRITSSEMELSLASEDGHTYHYHFKKWG